MTHIDEPLERLINRSLDGELTSEEREQLDRALGDNPAARQLLADYQSIDARAQDALRGVFVSTRPAVVSWRPSRGMRLAAAMGVLAAAAGLVLMVGPRLIDAERSAGPLSPPSVRSDPSEPPLLARVDPAPFANEPSSGDVLLADHIEESPPIPRTRDRRMTRDWLGVMDESGDRIYLLEMDHRRTRVMTVSANN
ncbi:MAG: hypothetical protein L6Q92_04560 [Phycisphaerae bacterium]|nr:hypothetical protein [Phycisphaerae bacterium]